MSWFTAGVDPLTRTEADVLGLVDNGLSNREIAATLSISVGTVKCHLHRTYEQAAGAQSHTGGCQGA